MDFVLSEMFGMFDDSLVGTESWQKMSAHHVDGSQLHHNLIISHDNHADPVEPSANICLFVRINFSDWTIFQNI